MDDGEFWELTYGELFGWDDVTIAEFGEVVEQETEERDQPAHTVLLHRTFLTYTEVAWIRGYPSIRRIIVSMPRMPGLTAPAGVVFEIPVGFRDLASAEAFRRRFERVADSYVREGWTIKPCEVRADGRHW